MCPDAAAVLVFPAGRGLQGKVGAAAVDGSDFIGPLASSELALELPVHSPPPSLDSRKRPSFIGPSGTRKPALERPALPGPLLRRRRDVPIARPLSSSAIGCPMSWFRAGLALQRDQATSRVAAQSNCAADSAYKNVGR